MILFESYKRGLHTDWRRNHGIFTETALYTVPTGKQVSLSVWICNTNASAQCKRWFDVDFC